MNPRTRMLIEAPIARTLVWLAWPNVLVMVAQASVGLIETYFVGQLGTDALAGVSLVFPAVMLMQMMSAGAMGGGISSAIARALGGGRRSDAEALVVHAIAIGLVFGLVFMLGALTGGRWLYSAMGGSGASLEAAMIYSNVVFRARSCCGSTTHSPTSFAAPATWRCRPSLLAPVSRCSCPCRRA